MGITRRIVAMLVCAALLLAPCGVLAEEYVIPAGEVTKTAIMDAYAYGMQIDMSASFGALLDGEHSPRTLAAQSLLEKAQLTLSFYDDFGVARARGVLTLSGVSLLTVDAQVLEDGSAQIVTNLTGDMVLMLPAGTVTPEGIDMSALRGASRVGIESPEYEFLPAFDRLSIAMDDLETTFLSHLLGWVSSTQRKTGDLYLFDGEYIEATPERDAVAQRQITTIRGKDLCELFVNIMYTVRDERGEFQQALADSLASLGVTRYQVRQVIDALFTQEQMDPAVDWVQPSSSVLNDGELCTMGDVVYAVKKIAKCTDHLRFHGNQNEIKMVLSYDDYGHAVGLDFEVPVFTEALPYEGFFSYSRKTDEFDQRAHIAHGELQLFDGNRLSGGLSAQQGQDVGGVNTSGFSAYIDLQNGGMAVGAGVDTAISYHTDGGDKAEAFDASALFSLRQNGASLGLLSLSLSGSTAVDEFGFGLGAHAQMAVPGAAFVADIVIEPGDVTLEAFPEGTPVDLTDEQAMAQVRQVAFSQLMSTLSVIGTTDASVMNDLLTLME